MGYSSYVGSFNIDTTKTAGQTQSVSGVGFTPKIVMFWWSGTTRTSDGVAGEDYCLGFGAMTGATSRIAFAGMSDDAAATSDTNRGSLTTACIISYLNGTSALDGAADWGSFDADGFTITIDDQFSTALRVSYLALGGTDLTNVYIGTKLIPAATGNFATTGVGFQPDAALFIRSSNPDSTNVHNNYSIGWATSSTAQGRVVGAAIDNNGSSDTFGYGYNGECAGSINSPTAVDFRTSFVSFGADGFTLNNLETGNITIGFICLKGGQYKVHELTTRTDGNDIVESDVGFTPVALMFLSANRALSTSDTPTAHHRISIGAATSASNRAAQAISDEDGLVDMECATANYDTACYANIADDAIVGLMDIKSIDTGAGFTAVMDDADPSACWVTYLAIGAAAGGNTCTLNATQAANTISATAVVTNTANATLAQTQASDTITAAATTETHGTLTQTQAGDTLSASVTTEAKTTLDKTQAGDTLTASITTEAKASLTATQADQTISASATVSNGPAASLDVSQAGNTLSASIATEAHATLEQAQGGNTLSASITTEAKATLTATQAGQTLSANVTEAVVSTASLNQTQAGDTVSASITTTASAVLNVTQSGNTSSSTAYAYTITYARPNADTSAGEWTDQDGGTSNLYATIDETTAEDSDYIRSPETPSVDPVVFALSSISTPTYRLSHAVRYRYAKMPDGTDDTLNFTVQLREGYTNEANPGTLIAEWMHSNVSTTLTTAEQALTASEAESISNYSDLFIRMVADTA